MPRIQPKNRELRKFRGLHLYHTGWSNCSMRVRMVLAEKGLEWTSHHVDLRTGEQATPEYFSINPNGVVPTLVHDGETWIESNDIIAYLDEAFPEPALAPPPGPARERMGEWMKLASAIHVSGVKTWMYGNGPPNRKRRSPAEIERYRRLQRNRELREFHTRYASAEGLGREACDQADRQLHGAFRRLDAWLAGHAWLAGDGFSLADITWAPLHYTLERAGFPFDAYPALVRWSAAVAARPCFGLGVVGWYEGPGDTAGNAR